MFNYANALASEDFSREVFKLLKSELNAEWQSHDARHVSWSSGRLKHELSISSHDNGDNYLIYICELYSGISPESALLIASDLNRRLVGVVFVAVPIGEAWSLFAYSAVLLKRGYAHVFFCYVMILKRVIGIVEHIVVQNWVREVVGLPAENFDNADNRSEFQIDRSISQFHDPLEPVFATGLWVSDLESTEFHRCMKTILDNSNAGFNYVSIIEDSDVSVLNDLKLGSKYIVDPGRSLRVFRDYDVSVDIKSIRHSELGWGLQEIQQFGYFASAFESKDGFGTGMAYKLANTLNFLTYKDLTNTISGNPPFLLVGTWIAVNEQVFHGQFISDVVLEELCFYCVGVFGEALADLVHPLNTLNHVNRFVDYLEKSELESQCEPNPFTDSWGGCNETLMGKGSLLSNVNNETQSDDNLLNEISVPVFIQLATWGIFGGAEVPVSSLEVIKHPEKSLFWLVNRVRHPHNPRVIILSGPTNDMNNLEIATNIENWLRKLRWPRIDWLIVQSPDADEPVRLGLRHFANSLSRKSDVELIFSEIHNYQTPWEHLLDMQTENVFNENESIEAGYEWIVTRPDVVDRSISRLRAMFEYSRAIKSGSSDVFTKYLMSYHEFVISIRKGEYELGTSYKDFLIERFEVDSETIDQLVSLETEHLLE